MLIDRYSCLGMCVKKKIKKKVELGTQCADLERRRKPNELYKLISLFSFSFFFTPLLLIFSQSSERERENLSVASSLIVSIVQVFGSYHCICSLFIIRISSA
jgi:hypothetical protein